MKKLIFIALALVLIFPSNGCRILKHKTLDKSSEQVKVHNDVQVLTKLVDSLSTGQKYFFDKSNTTVKETISYKTPVNDEPIELTASFKIDTAKSLKGDTALTLVGPGIKLTITRNPLNNNLTANIKTAGTNRNVAVNELLINRTITNNKDVVDSSKLSTTVKRQEKDSTDKSKIEIKKAESHLDKTKDNKPNFLVWVGVAAVICFFLWLGFKK